MMAGMIILAKAPFVPHGWEITQIEPIVPMSCLIAAHVLRKSHLPSVLRDPC